MIRGFESAHPLEPEAGGHVQWPAAFGAGLIAGAILLIVPRGSPWSSVTFFGPLVMGRGLPPGVTLSLLSVWLIHLVVSITYGLIITRIVARLTQSRAILTSGLLGLVFYC